MGLPLSGTRGRVTVKNVALAIEQFKVDPSADLPTGTTFEDFDATRGNQTFEVTVTGGIVRANVECRGYWDSANNPFSVGGGGFVAGQQISNCRFYVDRVGNRSWYFPAMVVNSPSTPVDVKGRVDFSVSLRNQGGFDYPV